MLNKYSPYWLWALLSLPALSIAWTLATATDNRVLHFLIHPTGEWSIRFLLLAMLASPLALVLRGWQLPRWLVKNRRYFGVAAFAYALAHAIFYLWSEPFSRALSELSQTEIWTGWTAFAIFIPLAATSMDYAQRKMGTWWKWLQRWSYVAASFAFLHWAALHDWRSFGEAAVWFAPLAILSAYRIWFWYLRPRPGSVSPASASSAG